MRPDRLAFPVLCLIVFVDLMGFGVILPLLPYTADVLGASAFDIGVLFASYSVAQLIAAPVLGHLSDRLGRKPVLLLALFGSVVSALLLARADTVEALLVARLVAGACGGSVAVVQAFVVDLAPPARRTRGLGLIGAAVGCGFIAGPAVGALLADGGLARVGLVSAGLSLIALLLAATMLPMASAGGATGVVVPRSVGGTGAGTSLMRPLATATFAVTAAFCAMEATLALLGADRFGLGPSWLGWTLAGAGIAMAVAQGGCAAPLVERFGPRSVAVSGALLLAAGLGLLPWLPLRGALAALMLASIGYGLFTPALSTLVADAAPERPGTAMGTIQASAAIARAAAPVAAGVAYGTSPALPYMAALVLSIAAAGCLPEWPPRGADAARTVSGRSR